MVAISGPPPPVASPLTWVGVLLAVVALGVAGTSAYLRWEAPSSSAGLTHLSGTPPTPVSLLSQTFAAIGHPNCYGRSPPCTATLAIFTNVTVPIPPDRLGVVNLSWATNVSCAACALYILQGPVGSEGGFPLNSYARLSVNGSGFQVVAVPGGPELLFAAQYQYPGVPFSLSLSVLYLGEVPLQ